MGHRGVLNLKEEEDENEEFVINFHFKFDLATLVGGCLGILVATLFLRFIGFGYV